MRSDTGRPRQDQTVETWKEESEETQLDSVNKHTETIRQIMRMSDTTNNNTQSIADYLAQLLKDKKQLAAFPNVFIHMERLLDDGE